MASWLWDGWLPFKKCPFSFFTSSISSLVSKLYHGKVLSEIPYLKVNYSLLIEMTGVLSVDS